MLGTREIGMAAFSGCAEVTAVHVLKGVQSLGEGVFQGMPALQEVYFEGGDASVLGESRFQFKDLLIYCPSSGSADSYIV